MGLICFLVLSIFFAGSAGVLVDGSGDEAERLHHKSAPLLKKQDIHLEKENQRFSSGVPEYDAAFNLAISEVQRNTLKGHVQRCTEADLRRPRASVTFIKGRCLTKSPMFMAGAGWTEMWTRDISYTVALAGALLDPEASRISLEKSISVSSIGYNLDKARPGIHESILGKAWTQDTCRHFGGWPHLSDAIVGAHGAWSLYLVTGDRDFLKVAREATENSLLRAESYAYDNSSGLFRGCASFMESNGAYPEKYWNKGEKLFATKALSTNILHYMAYKIAALMGMEFDAEKSKTDLYERKAADLRNAIRSRFWLPNKGYYAYVEDENGVLMEQMEALGESLVLLAPDFESDESRIRSIFHNTYRSDRGIPCLWPRLQRSSPDFESDAFTNRYHNGRTWPFVQGYWAVAAARHGRGDVMMEEMAKLLASSRLNNTFAEYYEDDGTFQQGHSRQLWSDAGFLSMIYQGLFGMVFEPSGLRFSPVKPMHPFAETITLGNVQYRLMTLDVSITGSGSRIGSFRFDGNVQDAFVPCTLRGRHTVQIRLQA